MSKHSIFLKAYHHPNGRTIHYSAARLRKDPNSPNGTSILDIDDDANPSSNTIACCPCWIFFYPAGPNRRLLEAVISRYAQHSFHCERDVLFLCINRPGKGGTSSNEPAVVVQHDKKLTPEREHIATSCQDIVSILDYYKISKASLLYMCAGSSFAYSFATMFPQRTTGNIVGISSWILRSSSSPVSNKKNDETSTNDDIGTPSMHSLSHRMAMYGIFGPKWMVSSLAGGIIGSANGLLNILPKHWTANGFKKSLSKHERCEFEKQFPEGGGVAFVELMHWIHEDDKDGNVSVFVNNSAGNEDSNGGFQITCTGRSDINHKDGDAKDIAVCLSTQQDLGLIYKSTVPPQKNVFLWHGENDTMISVVGSEWLASMIPNANLTKVSEGTHQGTMFFFPVDAMETINRISAKVSSL